MTNNAELLLLEEEIIALYLRLSRENELEGESNSIINQRAFLMDYAQKNGFKNIQVFTDNGISGVTFKRENSQKLLELIEAGKVKTFIVKDLSRLFRNYIEAGQLIEVTLPVHNVRLIAVNDGVDSNDGDGGKNDMIPFINIMNEWYAKDISRKLRSTMRLKNSQGYAIGQPPYGYKYDEESPKNGRLNLKEQRS